MTMMIAMMMEMMMMMMMMMISTLIVIINFSSLGIDWSWNPVTSSASPDGAVKRAQLALSIARKQLGE